jgi:uncharacterized protein YoxC
LRSSRTRGYGERLVAHHPRRSAIDVFVLASGTFSILSTFVLVYLALRSVRDARGLRLVQHEVTVLMRETKDLAEEVHTLQHEIRSDQRATKTDINATKRTVEQVTEVVESAAGQVADAAVQVAAVESDRRRRLIRRILASQGAVP